jgi:hypothetical protein
MEGFIKLKFLYWHEADNAERVQSMWVSNAGENYRIENIPFYVLDFAFGDVVSAKEINGELYVNSLISESRHSTIRIVFFDKSIVQQTRSELKSLGCDTELSDKSHLIAVDVPPTVDYINVIKPYLEKGTLSDLWDYQEACLANVQNDTDE